LPVTPLNLGCCTVTARCPLFTLRYTLPTTRCDVTRRFTRTRCCVTPPPLIYGYVVASGLTFTFAGCVTLRCVTVFRFDCAFTGYVVIALLLLRYVCRYALRLPVTLLLLRFGLLLCPCPLVTLLLDCVVALRALVTCHTLAPHVATFCQRYTVYAHYARVAFAVDFPRCRTLPTRFRFGYPLRLRCALLVPRLFCYAIWLLRLHPVVARVRLRPRAAVAVCGLPVTLPDCPDVAVVRCLRVWLRLRYALR